jgi:hypothetical protein
VREDKPTVAGGGGYGSWLLVVQPSGRALCCSIRSSLREIRREGKRARTRIRREGGARDIDEDEEIVALFDQEKEDKADEEEEEEQQQQQQRDRERIREREDRSPRSVIGPARRGPSTPARASSRPGVALPPPSPPRARLQIMSIALAILALLTLFVFLLLLAVWPAVVYE